MKHHHGSPMVEAAIHEAGHAVALRALAREPLSVTLYRRDQYSASITYAPFEQTVTAKRDELTVLAAGAAAVHQFDPLANAGDAGDRVQMTQVARVICGLQADCWQIENELHLARERAARLTAECWTDIVDIAQRLIHLHDRIQRIEPRCRFDASPEQTVSLIVPNAPALSLAAQDSGQSTTAEPSDSL